MARRLWAQIGFPFPPRGFENRSLLENFDYLLDISSKKDTPETLSRVSLDAMDVVEEQDCISV